MSAIAASGITGVVLAGGRGSRMGGADKGLQTFNGIPLAQHTLQRLRPQVGAVMINANRHRADYEAFGAPVRADALPGYPGPLAGFLAGLTHCETPYLATVPCDTPLFPLDLVARLAGALEHGQADIAMAAARDEDGRLRNQPVFCVLKRELRDGLARFIEDGGRKVEAWAARHTTAVVPFDGPGDDARAFFNANTLDELRRLEQP